jgi:hypothetical protein
MDKTSMQHQEWTSREGERLHNDRRNHRQSMIYHFNHMYEGDYQSISYDKDGNVTSIED